LNPVRSRFSTTENRFTTKTGINIHIHNLLKNAYRIYLIDRRNQIWATVTLHKLLSSYCYHIIRPSYCSSSFIIHYSNPWCQESDSANPE